MQLPPATRVAIKHNYCRCTLYVCCITYNALHATLHDTECMTELGIEGMSIRCNVCYTSVKPLRLRRV